MLIVTTRRGTLRLLLSTLAIVAACALAVVATYTLSMSHGARTKLVQSARPGRAAGDMMRNLLTASDSSTEPTNISGAILVPLEPHIAPSGGIRGRRTLQSTFVLPSLEGGHPYPDCFHDAVAFDQLTHEMMQRCCPNGANDCNLPDTCSTFSCSNAFVPYFDSCRERQEIAADNALLDELSAFDEDCRDALETVLIEETQVLSTGTPEGVS